MSLKETQSQVDALGQTVDSIVESVQNLDQAIVQQEEKIAALQSSSEDNSAKLGQILDIIVRQQSTDAAELDAREPNRAGVVEMSEAKDGSVAVSKSAYQDVDSPEFKSWAENEAFLREKVEIMIHPSAERNADRAFEVSVNDNPGTTITFHRNKRYVVPRAVVETLARAKPVHFENEEYTKPNGDMGVRNPFRRGLRYPFSVISDPSGERGHRWLEKVLSEP